MDRLLCRDNHSTGHTHGALESRHAQIAEHKAQLGFAAPVPGLRKREVAGCEGQTIVRRAQLARDALFLGLRNPGRKWCGAAHPAGAAVHDDVSVPAGPPLEGPSLVPCGLARQLVPQEGRFLAGAFHSCRGHCQLALGRCHLQGGCQRPLFSALILS